MAKGVDPIQFTRATAAQKVAEERSRITFATFARQWIADTLFYRSETYRSQTIRLLDAYIHPSIGETALPDVKPAHVLAIVEALRHVPTTADRCRALIQQIFNHAIRKLLVDSNPAVVIRGVIKVPPKTQHRHLSKKELAAFWKKVSVQHTASAVTVYRPPCHHGVFGRSPAVVLATDRPAFSGGTHWLMVAACTEVVHGLAWARLQPRLDR